MTVISVILKEMRANNVGNANKVSFEKTGLINNVEIIRELADRRNEGDTVTSTVWRAPPPPAEKPKTNHTVHTAAQPFQQVLILT